MKHTYEEKFKKDLSKEVKQIIELFLNDYGPTWCEPYVALDHSGRGLYISLTEENEFDKLLTWKRFFEINYSLEFDNSNAAKKHLKNINVIVEGLKQYIKDVEEYESAEINK